MHTGKLERIGPPSPPDCVIAKVACAASIDGLTPAEQPARPGIAPLRVAEPWQTELGTNTQRHPLFGPVQHPHEIYNREDMACLIKPNS